MTRLWPAGEQIEIWDEGETPTGFNWQGAPHCITDVCNRWRIHTRWWEPDQLIQREYLKVVTDTGLLCLIYQELPSGSWFVARLYD
jgi:hypothetical protein